MGQEWGQWKVSFPPPSRVATRLFLLVLTRIPLYSSTFLLPRSPIYRLPSLYHTLFFPLTYKTYYAKMVRLRKPWGNPDLDYRPPPRLGRVPALPAQKRPVEYTHIDDLAEARRHKKMEEEQKRLENERKRLQRNHSWAVFAEAVEDQESRLQYLLQNLNPTPLVKPGDLAFIDDLDPSREDEKELDELDDYDDEDVLDYHLTSALNFIVSKDLQLGQSHTRLC